MNTNTLLGGALSPALHRIRPSHAPIAATQGTALSAAVRATAGFDSAFYGTDVKGSPPREAPV